MDWKHLLAYITGSVDQELRDRQFVAQKFDGSKQRWMVQMARNVTMAGRGFLQPGQYLVHDRDGKLSSVSADH